MAVSGMCHLENDTNQAIKRCMCQVRKFGLPKQDSLFFWENWSLAGLKC